MSKNTDNHYVDNERFYNALVDYNAKLTTARAAGKPLPKIPEYIGDCLTRIANHVAMLRNFRNYPYRDEMISDALENCILYIESFKPATGSNPFAYFTQCITFAFIRRIEREHKELYTKLKYLTNNATHDRLASYQEGEEAIDIGFNPNDEYVSNFIVEFERKQAVKKQKIRDNQRKKKQDAELMLEKDEDTDE